MKAATQSCSGKKPLSKFTQNPHYILEFQEHPFSRTPLNDCFCSKYCRRYCKKLNISLVKKKKKKMSDSLKRPADFRNLITSLTTSLFKLLESLLEPCSK